MTPSFTVRQVGLRLSRQLVISVTSLTGKMPRPTERLSLDSYETSKSPNLQPHWSTRFRQPYPHSPQPILQSSNICYPVDMSHGPMHVSAVSVVCLSHRNPWMIRYQRNAAPPDSKTLCMNSTLNALYKLCYLRTSHTNLHTKGQFRRDA